MKSLFVVVAVAVAAFAANIDTSFVSNVNLSNAEADFKFRWQYADMIKSQTYFNHSLPDCYVWSSGSVDGHVASQSYANANGMVAVAFAPSNMTFPYAVLGYASGEASVKVNLPSLFAGMISGTSTFKGGMVAMAVLNIVEMKPDGNPVRSNVVSLRSDSCTPEKVEKGEVSGMTCTATYDGKDTTVTYTYLTSTKAGILKYGETPVSPRSIETIVDVKNFKLTDEKNHARLNIALLTGKGAGSVKGNATVVRKDDEDVYVAVSGQAVINGTVKDVNIQISSESDDLDLTTKIMMNAILGMNYDFRVAHVDFPAGVESFIYDPAAGAGRVVYEALGPDSEGQL